MAATVSAKFFERFLCSLVRLRVLRAHRQAAKAERGKLLSHRALVHHDAELRLDPALQVDPPPTDHAVALRIGTVADQLRQTLLLCRAQQGRSARSDTARQSRKPFGIVPMDPVSQCLAIHTAGLSRRLAIYALHHQREGQHSPRRIRSPARPRRLAKPRCIQIQPCDRYRHRTLHPVGTRNHSPRQKGIPYESGVQAVGIIPELDGL